MLIGVSASIQAIEEEPTGAGQRPKDEGGKKRRVVPQLANESGSRLFYHRETVQGFPLALARGELVRLSEHTHLFHRRKNTLSPTMEGLIACRIGGPHLGCSSALQNRSD